MTLQIMRAAVIVEFQNYRGDPEAQAPCPIEETHDGFVRLRFLCLLGLWLLFRDAVPHIFCGFLVDLLDRPLLLRSL